MCKQTDTSGFVQCKWELVLWYGFNLIELNVLGWVVVEVVVWSTCPLARCLRPYCDPPSLPQHPHRQNTIGCYCRGSPHQLLRLPLTLRSLLGKPLCWPACQAHGSSCSLLHNSQLLIQFCVGLLVYFIAVLILPKTLQCTFKHEEGVVQCSTKEDSQCNGMSNAGCCFYASDMRQKCPLECQFRLGIHHA